MSEKTEQATPHKLRKAKELGQVSKSLELTTCISLLVMLSVVTALWPNQLKEIQLLLRYLLQNATHFQWNTDTVSVLMHLIFTKLIGLWLPLALSGVLAVILGTLVQTGMVWSGTPLIPNFKRLNAIQGLKKLFSTKLLFEAFKSIFKLASVTTLIVFIFRHQFTSILSLALVDPHHTIQFMMQFLLKLCFQLLILMTLLAFIDKFYTMRRFKKEQRMSKQEVKDEFKQREGDPKIKSKIKQLQQQLRRKTASLAQIKTADVVITNPTHLAIALKYDKQVMPAPKLICKVEGELVKEVKKTARKYDIPVVEHKILARLLHASVELNQCITPDLFPLTAAIYREIYAVRETA